MPISKNIILFIILSIGALCRFYLVSDVFSSDFYGNFILDPDTYIKQGQVLAHEGLKGLQAPFWRPPLYPLFLGLILKWSQNNLLLPLLIQVLLSTLSIGLVYRISMELTSSVGVSLTAASFMACNRTSIYFSGQFLIPALFVILMLTCFFYYLKFMNSYAPFPAFGSGFFCGLATLARPNFLFTALFLAGWISKEIRPLPKNNHSLILLFLIGFILPILPITWHNYDMSKSFIFITKIGGYNFFIGNNRDADGKTVWASKKKLLDLNINPNGDPNEIDQHYLAAAKKEIQQDPVHFIKLWFKKMYYLMNNHEISSNIDMEYFMKECCPWLNKWYFLSWGIIFPLAMVGMIFGEYNNKMAPPLLIFVIIFTLTLSLFFINARLRVPLVPVLCLFSSIGLKTIFSFHRRFSAKKNRIILTWFLFFLVSHTHFFGVDDPRDKTPINLIQATQFYEGHQYLACKKMLNHILDADPVCGDAYVLMSLVYQKENDVVLAKKFRNLAFRPGLNFEYFGPNHDDST
ncbi:MAG: glycosyltransferase family 39 protein [Candidatus Aureabacteria bacterium]|nr:glycosyltransferase family 39 protein [Candidatus Auribacterota bacterium]